MKTKTNSYSNKEITVSYNPSACINSGLCAKQLSEVFRTSVIPWIDLDAAAKETIMEQVNRCPSGALKYHLHHKDVA